MTYIQFNNFYYAYIIICPHCFLVFIISCFKQFYEENFSTYKDFFKIYTVFLKNQVVFSPSHLNINSVFIQLMTLYRSRHQLLPEVVWENSEIFAAKNILEMKQKAFCCVHGKGESAYQACISL